MKFKINYRTDTGSLREAFNHEFPYLKLEFFRTVHKAGQASARKEMIESNTVFEKIHPFIKEGTIRINPADTVADVERTFLNKFGLSVQVFRKQNNVWIETTSTDGLTLKKQNEMGTEASNPVKPAPRDRFLEESAY